MLTFGTTKTPCCPYVNWASPSIAQKQRVQAYHNFSPWIHLKRTSCSLRGKLHLKKTTLCAPLPHFAEKPTKFSSPLVLLLFTAGPATSFDYRSHDFMTHKTFQAHFVDSNSVLANIFLSWQSPVQSGGKATVLSAHLNNGTKCDFRKNNCCFRPSCSVWWHWQRTLEDCKE